MKRTLACLITLWLGGQAATANTEPQSAEDCVKIRPAIERLACFDHWYNTPAYLEPIEVPVQHRPSYGIIEALNDHEQRRPAGDYGLIMTRHLEHPAAEQERVILSVPALGVVGPRPLLALSCIDNITRLQLLLPQPLSSTRAEIVIRDEHGSQRLREPWRIIGGGYIAEAGRGIPSIDTTKQLLGATRLHLNSPESQIDGLTFDVSQLREHIRPLATACHWGGPFGAKP